MIDMATENREIGSIEAGSDSGTGKRKRGSRIIAWLCRIFGILCIAAVVGTLLVAKLPLELGYSEYYVISGSMEPQVPIYSILYARPVDPATLKTGDIASFKVGETTVVHRVKINNIEKRTLVTKGDANEDVDFREISYDNVRGKVVKQYPVLGEVLMMYLTRCGKILLVLLTAVGVLLFIASFEMSEYSRHKKKKAKKEEK